MRDKTETKESQTQEYINKGKYMMYQLPQVL